MRKRQPNRKIVKRLKNTFGKREYLNSNKHRKMCPTSLVIKEMQIKNTILNLSILPETHRMDKFKRWKMPNDNKDVVQLDFSATAGGGVNCYNSLGNC